MCTCICSDTLTARTEYMDVFWYGDVVDVGDSVVAAVSVGADLSV